MTLLRAVLALGLLAGLWLLVAYLARQAEDDVIDTLIKPVQQRFTGSDEALQARTAKKRQAADSIRRRAAHVESGSQVADVLRMVKR